MGGVCRTQKQQGDSVMTTSVQSQIDLPLYRPTPLLDRIRLMHGPVAQLGRFFLLADQAATDRGVHLELHTDLQSLIDANHRMQSAWGSPMVPIFDPAHSNLSAANSFWISGRDDNGMIVATQAARFFDMSHSNVAEELRSLRLFFAAPEKHLAIGARCIVDCAAAEGVNGRVTYSGGGWYHPKFRGCGLSRILPRISRALAFTQWNTDYTFSVVETVLVEKNVYRSYGYTNHSPSIRLTGSYREDMELELIWMKRAEMLADMSDYVAAAEAAKEVRNTEAEETNRASPLRQGNSSRS
jgi:hypothetical protein